MVCRANTCKCAFLFKLASNKDIFQDMQIKKYESYQWQSKFRIQCNVHFCINMHREDIFIKEFVGNQNFIFRIVAMILC